MPTSSLIDRFARLVFANKKLWIALGDWETRRLRHRLAGIAIDRPVYITGLARAGTTILLEALSHHPDLAFHSYRDYPLLFTPYAWHALLDRFSKSDDDTLRERAHRDRILVSPKSPEAMEEILWMAFFAHLHDPARSQLLTEQIHFPAFERFYRKHLQKLLLIHARPRYLAKANYQITRIPYLLKLFPDARFIVLVRNPLDHIASLMKQDRLFTAEQTNDRATLRHSQYSGHFEFGLDFRPINPGNKQATERVLELRGKGETVRAWAAYWSNLYGYLRSEILENPSLSRSVHLVRYEDLCDRPDSVLPSLLAFCDLEDGGWIARHRPLFRRPDYYQADFTEQERRIIAEETNAVARFYGYAE